MSQMPARADTKAGRENLRILPSQVYVIKAAVVRARSLMWLARGGRRGAPTGIRVLAYHRVSEDTDVLAVTPRNFAEQMDFLLAGGYTVVDLVDAAAMLRRGESPSRTVALTFDDGYRDVAEHAVPVLERCGFTATVFVVPGAIEGEVPFEWYERQPELIGWADIARLDGASPLRFEPHTTTHPNLLTLSDDDARREIAGCKALVEDQLGRPAHAFCYPAGLFGPRELALVEEAGYSVAVSCEPGINTAGGDSFALARVQIEARDSLLDFRAKLGGGHDRSFPLRKLHRRLRYGAMATPRAASSER
jgi:peptidoglycan/xylan/chitin deacetylase (PgdA/CDA1 family)